MSKFEKQIAFDNYLTNIFKLENRCDLYNYLISYYNKKTWKIYDFIDNKEEFEKEINNIKEFIKTEKTNRIKSLIEYLINDLKMDISMDRANKIQHLQYIEILKNKLVEINEMYRNSRRIL